MTRNGLICNNRIGIIKQKKRESERKKQNTWVLGVLD